VPLDLSWLSDSLVSAVTKRCVVETLFNKQTDQVDHAAGPYSGISCKGEPKYTDTDRQNGERCADLGIFPKTDLDVLCACPLDHDQIGH
jgi:hypothetical protein